MFGWDADGKYEATCLQKVAYPTKLKLLVHGSPHLQIIPTANDRLMFIIHIAI